MTLVIIMFRIAKTSVTIIIVIAALNNLKNKEIISKYIDIRKLSQSTLIDIRKRDCLTK